MKIQRLASLIETPEVQRRLLGDYSGAYSIGVTTNPSDPDTPAIRVRVQGTESSNIPSELVLDGEIVAVVANTRFTPPIRL
jgi:hypothetical protein